MTAKTLSPKRTVKARKGIPSPPVSPNRGGSRATASYLKLAIQFPIRPLKSETNLENAIRVLDGLLSRKKPLDEQEQGYLESLGHEIERFEAAHLPMPSLSEGAMLRHLIDAKRMTLSQLASKTGIALSTLSSVTHEKRKLNRAHIESLGAFFGVSPAVFLGR